MRDEVEGLKSAAISRSLVKRGKCRRNPTQSRPVANCTLEFITRIGRSVKRPYITVSQTITNTIVIAITGSVKFSKQRAPRVFNFFPRSSRSYRVTYNKQCTALLSVYRLHRHLQQTMYRVAQCLPLASSPTTNNVPRCSVSTACIVTYNKQCTALLSVYRLPRHLQQTMYRVAQCLPLASSPTTNNVPRCSVSTACLVTYNKQCTALLSVYRLHRHLQQTMYRVAQCLPLASSPTTNNVPRCSVSTACLVTYNKQCTALLSVYRLPRHLQQTMYRVAQCLPLASSPTTNNVPRCSVSTACIVTYNKQCTALLSVYRLHRHLQQTMYRVAQCLPLASSPTTNNVPRCSVSTACIVTYNKQCTALLSVYRLHRHLQQNNVPRCSVSTACIVTYNKQCTALLSVYRLHRHLQQTMYRVAQCLPLASSPNNKQCTALLSVYRLASSPTTNNVPRCSVSTACIVTYNKQCTALLSVYRLHRHLQQTMYRVAQCLPLASSPTTNNVPRCSVSTACIVTYNKQCTALLSVYRLHRHLQQTMYRVAQCLPLASSPTTNNVPRCSVSTACIVTYNKQCTALLSVYRLHRQLQQTMYRVAQCLPLASSPTTNNVPRCSVSTACIVTYNKQCTALLSVYRLHRHLQQTMYRVAQCLPLASSPTTNNVPRCAVSTACIVTYNKQCTALLSVYRLHRHLQQTMYRVAQCLPLASSPTTNNVPRCSVSTACIVTYNKQCTALLSVYRLHRHLQQTMYRVAQCLPLASSPTTNNVPRCAVSTACIVTYNKQCTALLSVYRLHRHLQQTMYRVAQCLPLASSPTTNNVSRCSVSTACIVTYNKQCTALLSVYRLHRHLQQTMYRVAQCLPLASSPTTNNVSRCSVSTACIVTYNKQCTALRSVYRLPRHLHHGQNTASINIHFYAATCPRRRIVP